LMAQKFSTAQKIPVSSVSSTKEPILVPQFPRFGSQRAFRRAELRWKTPFTSHILRKTALTEYFHISSQTHKSILNRDHGICALCGIDTLMLHEAISYVGAKFAAFAPSWGHPPEFWQFRRAIGKRASRWPRSLWDADHILPLSEGGTDELGNLRTLCLKCHAAETRKLRNGSNHAA
jgi:5-methylcytosine-specific restriction endonuclease McrA